LSSTHTYTETSRRTDYKKRARKSRINRKGRKAGLT
jgi:hypothetical protein